MAGPTDWELDVSLCRAVLFIAFKHYAEDKWSDADGTFTLAPLSPVLLHSRKQIKTLFGEGAVSTVASDVCA